MSAAEDLLHDLAEHGVTLWQEAGQLRYRAPAGAMTPATMAAMKQHKPELLALLAANDCGGQDRKVAPRVDGAVTGRYAPVRTGSPLSAVRTGPLVLTFELDAGQATCIDPVSTSIDAAVADIRQHFPGRVGRVWRNGQELA